jgi:type VI secretion system protein ImpJ
MSVFNKVVWSEGLFLRPQHFQQQDRFFERYVETRCAALRSHSWGFTELELERDFLAIGKIGIRRASGVFPDGTPFRMPEDEPLPTPLEIGAQVRDQLVSLVVPLRRPGSVDADRGNAADGLVRHAIQELESNDSSAGSPDTALLEVAALRSRLLLASEPGEAYARIPAAHVLECRADRQVVLDERFIPTVLDAKCAPRLATFMAELQGLFHQRGEALAGRVSATGRGSTAEIAEFLLLQIVNRYEPLVTHLLSVGLVHPEDLFRVCLSAAGELATITQPSKRPTAFVAYQHERLRECFDPVIAALRAALSVVLEQAAIPIPIESKRFGISVATVVDRSLFGSAVFILAARADIQTEDLRRRFPNQLKIGPVERIRDLVNLQLPGVPVSPLPVAPRQIPFHTGFAYFELDQSSELWQQLGASGGIGMHVAGEFPGLKMEFWAVRGG